eukprot:14954512-Alexandrium_andersonii.AAC.1
MPPEGPEPGEQAYRALQQLAADGAGPRGSTAKVAQARLADNGGAPLVGAASRYVNTASAELGRWLQRNGAVLGRKYVHPSARGALEFYCTRGPR